MKIKSTDSQRDKNVFSPSNVHFWHFCQGLWKNNNCNARVTTFFIVSGHLILEGLLKMATNFEVKNQSKFIGYMGLNFDDKSCQISNMSTTVD